MDFSDIAAGTDKSPMAITAAGLVYLTALFAPAEYSERAFRLLGYWLKPSPEPGRRRPRARD